MDGFTDRQLLEIGIAATGSIALGILLKKTVIPMLRKLARKSKWEGDDLIINSISPWIIFWFFLGACLYVLPILVKVLHITEKTELRIQQGIGALYIFSIGMVLARVVTGLLQVRSHKQEAARATASILGNIIKGIIYSIAFILILQSFGVAIAPLLAALGVGGVAVALALQPTLSNLFAGLQLISSGRFNTGDFIQLENGEKGFITDITWRSTTLVTADNNIMIIPNNKMATSIVLNYFLLSRELLFNVPVGISYNSDLEKAERVCIQTATAILEQLQVGADHYEPFVRFYRFGDSSIDLKVFFRVKQYADQFLVTHMFIKELYLRFKAENIEIPFPVTTVMLQREENGQ